MFSAMYLYIIARLLFDLCYIISLVYNEEKTDNVVQNTISTEIPLNYSHTELKISSPVVANNAIINTHSELQIASPEVAYYAINTYNTVTNLIVNNKEETITQSLINKLLNILKFETPLTFLPKDCRTLLKTKSSKIINIREVQPGNYYHFGLKNGIIKYSLILPLNGHIKIAIGVDGLPISKSSSGQFWPVLAYIIAYHDYVFPVGIYYGFQEPLDSNDFLYDFISEIIELTTNGIILNNEFKKVTLEVMCCDVLAKRKLIEIVRSHSSLYDLGDPKYSDATHKDKLWKTIGDELNQPDNLFTAITKNFKRMCIKC
ncbi:hypothetical protein AGLY_016707 [Aphis glycines]|uniref:MADF domain-containing protein n=1 Tax=Aphis glycines TaxID=307491 RepID=A0A6G0SWZ7_APHGL|nr:hypothetical protein AGLY_016707 [Aphis glycines]